MRGRPIVLAASLLAAGLALSGCESFDPTDWFNTKKPLPGERKEVFPGGVPGVPQGVPPELVKGYQPTAAPPPEVAEEQPKPEKPKPEKPKPRAKAKPKPKPAPQQTATPQQASPPRSASTGTTGGQRQPPAAATQAWPEPQQTGGQPAPAPGPHGAVPFPDPPQR